MNRPLGMYPRYVSIDPGFTKELLAQIAHACKVRQPLNDEQQDYLVDVIGKILRGVPPERALYLTRPSGAPNTTWSNQSVLLYNRIEELRGKGKTRQGAIAQVASEKIAKKRGAKGYLTPSAIDRVYTAISASIRRSRKRIENSDGNTKQE